MPLLISVRLHLAGGDIDEFFSPLTEPRHSPPEQGSAPVGLLSSEAQGGPIQVAGGMVPALESVAPGLEGTGGLTCGMVMLGAHHGHLKH